MKEKQELRTAVSLLVSAYANMERAMKILGDLGIEVNNCARFSYRMNEDRSYNRVLLQRGMTTLSDLVGEKPTSIYPDSSYGLISISGVDFSQEKMRVTKEYEDKYE